jgi:hypothetical protein
MTNLRVYRKARLKLLATGLHTIGAHSLLTVHSLVHLEFQR